MFKVFQTVLGQWSNRTSNVPEPMVHSHKDQRDSEKMIYFIVPDYLRIAKSLMSWHLSYNHGFILLSNQATKSAMLTFNKPRPSNLSLR
jgi:hypothetical protein